MIKPRKVPDSSISHALTVRGQEWPVAGVSDSTGSDTFNGHNRVR